MSDDFPFFVVKSIQQLSSQSVLSWKCFWSDLGSNWDSKITTRFGPTNVFIQFTFFYEKHKILYNSLFKVVSNSYLKEFKKLRWEPLQLCNHLTQYFLVSCCLEIIASYRHHPSLVIVHVFSFLKKITRTLEILCIQWLAYRNLLFTLASNGQRDVCL